MFLLFIYNEYIYEGFKTPSLLTIDFLCIISSIFVITNKNPIVSVLFVIALFVGIACHLLMAGIDFIGLSYLLVYVGAVSILFIFILMLINIRVSELSSDTSNTIPLVVIISLTCMYCISQVYPNFSSGLYNFSTINKYLFTSREVDAFNDKLSYASSKSWDTSIAEMTQISSIGNIIYTSHSMWLIITSIILLLAMVGAIVITIKQPEQ